MLRNKLDSERTTNAQESNVRVDERVDPVRDSFTRARAANCRRQVRAAVTGVVLALCLAGCAWSPGMSFNPPSGTASPGQAEAGNGLASSSVRATADARTGKGVDAPPTGSLIEITDALVEKERAERSKTVPDDVTQLFAQSAPYTLGAGDILSIVIWDHPELNMPGASASTGPEANSSDSMTSGYTVDAGGMIQYAYIGPLKVAGLTEMEARDLLAQKLSRYVRQPQVTLRIQAYRSKRVYLDGAIRNPGVQVLNDMPMTLPEAINRAGGFTPVADRSMVAITRGQKTVIVDIPGMIAKGVNPDNIELRRGDMVRVFAQTDTKVYVFGEVQRPGSLTFNNGRMSLNEALGDAGGISQTSGDASQVFVVRGRDVGKPVVFHLNAGSPAAMATADGFELKPNDVVFVDASALVRWSRVIGLIVPSTQAAAAGRAIGY
ncbi:polysaccharide biosynthesis/export family protein [Paraburkholderia sediminicola]|jgi:polysaccharide export outer membrane protein|uniref:polysaccharide biosynthesis/export family protein n=1 Tax=Paraburkholderia TaxID=1822464 RepID=UPI0038B797EB